MDPYIILRLSVNRDGTISLWDTDLERHRGAADEAHVDLVLTPEQDTRVRIAYRTKWPPEVVLKGDV